jgi:hypothetical protein
VHSSRGGLRRGGDVPPRVSGGQAGIPIIDVSQIDGNVSKVMGQCATSTGLTMPQAFGGDVPVDVEIGGQALPALSL